MKLNILFVNLERGYDTPPGMLQGRTGKAYGSTAWSEQHRGHVCRLPEDQCDAALYRDIAEMSSLPYQRWLAMPELECSDGTCFNRLVDAERYEESLTKPAPITPLRDNPDYQAALAQSGSPVTRSFVEQASATQLRLLAGALKVPSFRKYTKAGDLRGVILSFLGFTQPAVAA